MQLDILRAPMAVAPDRTSPSTALRSDRLGRLALLVLGIVVAFSVVRAFGPLTYAGDLWRQADTASMARNYAEHGLNLFMPQINWGGNGPGYVESELPIMPWLTALLYTVFGEHEFLGRLVSLAFMLVATWAFWGLAKRLLTPAAARWALIAWAVSPIFMRYGTAFMPEATVLAFTMLALLAFCRWLQEDRPIWLAATAGAVALAGVAKPTSLHVGLVMAVWLLLTHRERLRRPLLWVAALASVVLPVLWLQHGAWIHQTYGNTFGVLSGGDNKFGSLSMWLTPDPWLGNLRNEAIFVYGVVGIPLAALGVAWLVRMWRRGHRPAAAPMLLAGSIGLVALYFVTGRYAGSDMGIQYHVYSLPYAALAVGAGIMAARGLLRQASHRTISGHVLGALGILTVVALGAQSGNVFAQSFSNGSGVLGTCSQGLAAISAPTDLVVVGTNSATTVGGVANNFQDPTVLYQADRYGWILAADQYQPALLAKDQAQGARWFVNPYPEQIARSGALAQWLDVHATPVRNSAEHGCEIWALNN